MNRRQRKKQEEKRIRQEMYNVLGHLGEMADSIVMLTRSIRGADEAFTKWTEETRKAMEEQMETDRILKRAYVLPKGTDKSLLKHHGILEDSGGWIYDVYYDEANDEYFAELLEGGDDGHGKEEGDHA